MIFILHKKRAVLELSVERTGKGGDSSSLLEIQILKKCVLRYPGSITIFRHNRDL